jgi:hypothetical protein
MSQGKSALGIVRKYHPNVTQVRDAKRDARIEVTSQDCKGGTRKGPSSCAMAKAFMREYDGAIISLSTAYLVRGKRAYRYHVPHSVSREIVSFDRSKKFSPGEYSLKAPSKQLRLGCQRRASGTGGVRTNTETARRHHKTAGIRAL